MEIEMGYVKYDNIRSNAYWSRVEIDTTLKPDADAGYYKRHLEDCLQNPTVGMLAKRKFITKKPMNYPEYAVRNRKILERNPEVDQLRTSINIKLKKDLYPKTLHIRKYIIDNDRVVLDYIEPAKGYSALQKAIIFCKKFI